MWDKSCVNKHGTKQVAGRSFPEVNKEPSSALTPGARNGAHPARRLVTLIPYRKRSPATFASLLRQNERAEGRGGEKGREEEHGLTSRGQAAPGCGAPGCGYAGLREHGAAVRRAEGPQGCSRLPAEAVVRGYDVPEPDTGSELPGREGSAGGSRVQCGAPGSGAGRGRRGAAYRG